MEPRLNLHLWQTDDFQQHATSEVIRTDKVKYEAQKEKKLTTLRKLYKYITATEVPRLLYKSLITQSSGNNESEAHAESVTQCSLKRANTTTTTTVLRPFKYGTTRVSRYQKKHPPTILITIQSLSASSIYHDP